MVSCRNIEIVFRRKTRNTASTIKPAVEIDLDYIDAAWSFHSSVSDLNNT